MKNRNISYMDLVINPVDLDILGEINLNCKNIIDTILDSQDFYMYEQAKEIIAYEIYTRFRDADRDKNYRGKICFFYGDYHTGKSFLVRYAARWINEKFNSYWRLPDACPIIIIDVPDNINSAKQFLLFLLSELDYPLDPMALKNWGRTHELEKKLREKVIIMLEKYQTRLLVLDECQRLLNARNRNLPNIFESIKDLTNKRNWSGALRTAILFSGTHDGLPLLESTDWIQGRTHSIRMRELKKDEYAYLLWTIYTDYVEKAVSPEWNLAIYNHESHTRELNPEIASFLFQRTRGKVALTVEIIRDAVIQALNRGQLYPDLNDYKIAIVEGEKYESLNLEQKNNEFNENENQIMVGFNDRYCKIEGCPRSRNPYSNVRYLLNHYKRKHKKVEILNKAGGRM